MRVILGGLVLLAGAAQGADFTGDGRADLVWRDDIGRPVFWTMAGFSRDSRTVLERPRDASWTLAATADFDGDGKDDLLWISLPGQIEIWRTSDGAASDVYVVDRQISATDRFLGVGKFDADNRADIIWENRSTQTLYVWHMDGATIDHTDTLPLSSTPGWELLGVGDNNGDGLADVLWRREDGHVQAWHLNGANVLAQPISADAVPADYHLDASGDLDGDGQLDLLWRDAGLRYQIWFLGSTQEVTHWDSPLSFDSLFTSNFDAAPQRTPSPPLSGGSWKAISIADFDGDGHNDLAAVNATGTTGIVMLQGLAVLDWNSLAPDADMPYSGFRGWSLPAERPSISRNVDTPAQLDIRWPPINGAGGYRLFVSDQPDPATTGTAVNCPDNTTNLPTPPNQSSTPLRYFALSVDNHGLLSAPSPDAFALDFETIELNHWSAMTLGDFNGDGCLDLIGGRGDCLGGFSYVTEFGMGLDAVLRPGRAWRDMRFGDLTGDGIDDVIANVYAPITDEASQVLMYRGLGGGMYQPVKPFSDMNIRGFGETIVFADFDNDGDLDVFLPHYTHHSHEEHNWLLLNDGIGNFTDIADDAGIAMRDWPGEFRVEGAQAVDINDDGWIDLYVGSHLFINQGTAGGLRFVDVREEQGLPLQFEEGAKFIDWNNDGLLDLVTQHPYIGPSLYLNSGSGYYNATAALPLRLWYDAYGMFAGDVDGDGRPDLMLAGGCNIFVFDDNCFDDGSARDLPHLYLQREGQTIEHFLYDDGRADTERGWNDLQILGDFDNNGTVDIATRYIANYGTTVLRQRAQDRSVIVVHVLDVEGRKNQQGRVVRLRPLARPDFVMTQVVDGGSGYMSIGPYALTYSTPVPGPYQIDVQFDDGVVTAVAKPGSTVTIKRGGSIEIAPLSHAAAVTVQ